MKMILHCLAQRVEQSVVHRIVFVQADIFRQVFLRIDRLMQFVEQRVIHCIVFLLADLYHQVFLCVDRLMQRYTETITGQHMACLFEKVHRVAFTFPLHDTRGLTD